MNGNKLHVLHSEQDASVNFVEEQLAGFLEARYVRRCADYFVCYLSSHSGCNRGCEFCHLTAINTIRRSAVGEQVHQHGALLRHQFNLDSEPVVIKRGDRIAQIVFAPVARAALVDVGDRDLSDTVRGVGGFGSTGK